MERSDGRVHRKAVPPHADRVLLVRRRGAHLAAELTITEPVKPLLEEVRRNPLLWLLSFVPVVFACHQLTPESYTLLFVLSVFAIVPLAALLSHATESVAAKTG